MINQFSGNAAIPPPQPSANSQPISEEKTARLNEVLSEYDAENLSDADAQAIVSQIQEMGIDPGAGLAKIISDAGLNPQGIGNQFGISAPSQALERQEGISGSVDKEALIALDDLLEKHDANPSSTGNWAEIRRFMTDQGFDMDKPMINIRA